MIFMRYYNVTELCKFVRPDAPVSRQYIHELIMKKKIKPSIKSSCYLFTQDRADEIKQKFFSKD